MMAVILAAGEGTRMGKLTEKLSKVMLPIQGKPLLEYHINHLKKFGVTNFYINTHYLPESIMNYFHYGEKWGVHITYSYEKELYGTAGALQPFRHSLNESFILLFGDVFTTINVTQLENFHKKHQASMSIVVHPTTHPQDSDLVIIGDGNKIKNLYCKPHDVLPLTNL